MGSLRRQGPRAWLYTIGINLALNEVRRRRRWHPWERMSEPAWANEADPDLWRAIASLEPRQRAALLLNVPPSVIPAAIERTDLGAAGDRPSRLGERGIDIHRRAAMSRPSAVIGLAALLAILLTAAGVS
jgi:hypothetical protein